MATAADTVRAFIAAELIEYERSEAKPATVAAIITALIDYSKGCGGLVDKTNARSLLLEHFEYRAQFSLSKFGNRPKTSVNALVLPATRTAMTLRLNLPVAAAEVVEVQAEAPPVPPAPVVAEACKPTPAADFSMRPPEPALPPRAKRAVETASTPTADEPALKLAKTSSSASTTTHEQNQSTEAAKKAEVDRIERELEELEYARWRETIHRNDPEVRRLNMWVGVTPEISELEFRVGIRDICNSFNLRYEYPEFKQKVTSNGSKTCFGFLKMSGQVKCFERLGPIRYAKHKWTFRPASNAARPQYHEW